MIPRGIVDPLIRLLVRTFFVVLLVYSLVFVFHISHNVQAHLHALLQPQPCSDLLHHTHIFSCHECAAASTRASAIFTCHDCTLPSADDRAAAQAAHAAVLHPVSRQTALGVRHNLIRDTLADTWLMALGHCQWDASWWCHGYAAWVVRSLLDAPSVEFHPATLISCALLLACAVYWLNLLWFTCTAITRDRKKRLAVERDALCVTSQAQDTLVGGSNSSHTQ